MTTIAIIGSKGIPARYGGFETLAENLVKHLGKRFNFIIYCSKKAYEEQPEKHLGAQLVYLPLDANGAQSIPYDIWSMIDANRREADIMLVLGVSGCIFLPLLRLFYRGRILVNLDGLDWKRPKWGLLARTFLKLSESIAARFADELVADNEAIQDYIREMYGKDSFLVEYGGDHAASELPERNNQHLSVVALHRQPRHDTAVDVGFERYAIAVCRIEPENHIHTILEAFSEAGSLPLVFLGNWDNSEYGRNLRARYGSDPNLRLLDPVFEPSTLFQLRSNASLYVHGHSSGGTNPSLVESMSLGLPVIAYDVVFNRFTTEGGATYFHDASSLISQLSNLQALSLAENGVRMKALADRRYSWSRIADKYRELLQASSKVPDQERKTSSLVELRVEQLATNQKGKMDTDSQRSRDAGGTP